jgi:hypothetical protein
MAIRAKISAGELTRQVTSSYVGETFEVLLINSPGTSYQPGFTDDASFAANEVAQIGGYRRQTLTFAASDITSYSDGGVALATKAAVFAHDGGGSTYTFSHVVLARGDGNVQSLDTLVSSKPAGGVDGSYTSLPVVTTGSGIGLTVNLTVANSGIALTDWLVTIEDPGYGYVQGDSLAVTDAVLSAAGAIVQGAGQISFAIATVSDGQGEFVSVAPSTNNVVMSDGNEAVFYFNLKQFGYN